MATAVTSNALRSSNTNTSMRQHFVDKTNYPDQFQAKLPPAPLLSYPLTSNHPATVISDSKAASDLAQRTAWDIREHDLDRFLEARHGCKIEDFWTSEFIHTYGRDYCEKLLQYIILFNQEEVGGYAVMFVDQMMMWQPHYFPYAMKYKATVDDLFEPDQVEHFSRKFLEKVTQWCKVAYEMNKSAWDHLLDNPPAGEELEAFIAMVEQQHNPSKLKTMHIVPEGREDDWPCNYFARARTKTAVPQLQLEREAAQQSIINSNKVQTTAISAQSMPDNKGAAEATSNANSDAAANEARSSAPVINGSSVAQTTGVEHVEQQATVTHAVRGEGANDGFDGDDSDSDQKPRPRGDSRLPQSPQSKKAALQQESKNKLAVPKDLSDRRVQSAPQTRATLPDVKATRDWLNVSVNKDEGRGGERRAVSNEQQSRLIAGTAKPFTSGPSPAGVPPTGRGGAIAAVGQYEYRPGATPPVFTYVCGRDVVVQNNVAYMQHKHYSFRRHPVPLPDHATTHRPGSNVYMAGMARSDISVPNLDPSLHFSHVRNQPDMYSQTVGRIQSQGQRQPNAFYPQTQSQPQSYVTSPQPVQTVSHDLAPTHIMASYIEVASANRWQDVNIPPMSRVHQQPNHLGYPPMRAPAPLIARPHHPFAFQTPQLATASPCTTNPTTRQHIDAVRAVATVVTPMVARRDLTRSESMTFSPRAINFQPDGGVYPQAGTNQRQFSFHGPPTASTNRPHRLSKENLPLRHGPVGSQDTMPFPTYMDTMENPIGLPEDKQCEANFIGPAAEDVCTLWFADIPPGSTAAQLRAFIATVIPVKSLREIAYTDRTPYNKGWTFVDFLSNRDARNALEYFAGRPFNGGRLKVQVPTRRTQTWAEQHGHEQSSSLGEGRGTASGRGLSFNGSNITQHNGFSPFNSSPTTRRTRGSSLSQAASAIRRNSAFTSQDARSDLPLELLPEVKELSKPTSPMLPEAMPVLKVAVEEKNAQGPKKPNAKKKKKPKRKLNDKSRDTSIAPSNSNMPSMPGSPSRPSTAEGSQQKSETSQTQSQVMAPPSNIPTYASIANAAKASRVLKNAQAKNDLGSSLKLLEKSSTWAEEAELAAAKEIDRDNAATSSPSSNGGAEKIEARKSSNSKGMVPRTSEKEATASLDVPVEAPTEPVNNLPMEVKHEQPLIVGAKTKQELHNKSNETDETVLVQSNPEAETQPDAVSKQQVTSAQDATEQQNNDDAEDKDAVASIACMSDDKSESTTVSVEQPKTSVAKSSKIPGPAQTESFSVFGSMKQQKAAQKSKQIQAKKARKASRKVSNNSAGTITAYNAKEHTLDIQEDQVRGEAIAESAQGMMKAEDQIHEPDAEALSRKVEKAQRKHSDSSSMAGTPETAREYPTSAPNTPIHRVNTAPGFLLGSQSDQALGSSSGKEVEKKDDRLDKPVDVGSNTKSLSTALGGELKSDPANSLDHGQQSQRSSQTPSLGNLDFGAAAAVAAKKAENSAPATITYAQMAKSGKELRAKKDGKAQGLSVRDVNVPH